MPTVTTSVLQAIRAQARVLTPFYKLQNAVVTYEAILAAATQTLGESPADLTFVHLSVPHTPQIWDRKRDTFRSGIGFWRADYMDNFALADRALGEIRSRMERNGTWDASAVLVTSDHGFDEWGNKKGAMNDEISFLLKMPSQSQSLVHTTSFSGVVVKELLLRVLRGDLEDPRSLSAWLEEQGARS